MITEIIFRESDGIVIGSRSTVPGVDLPLSYGCSSIISDEFVDPNQFYIKEGSVFPLPSKPHETSTWDLETEKWITSSALEMEYLWSEFREKRRKILLECDWTQLADVGLSQEQKILWANYRQQLRDIPETISDPSLIVWPTPPGVI